MFNKLRIHNYILIEEVEIQFSNGFNVITGETGAGKSVLMGALSLIFGQRTEPAVLKDKTKKCFIEAEIHLSNNKLKPFFEKHELDFERETIIRREINPKGKSRAFINDSPVVLKVLEQFSQLFFDLHSQNQNVLIKDEFFRLGLVDTIADSTFLLEAYRNKLQAYRKMEQEIQAEVQENNAIQKELDFIQYQFKQLEEAHLEVSEQDNLEEELDKLNHAEEIKQALAIAHNYVSGDEQSAISQLLKVEQELSKLASFYKNAELYLKRIQSDIIDLQDLAPDLESELEGIEYNPERIEEINIRLNVLMDLQRKYQVENVAALIDIKEGLDTKLLNFGNFNFEIDEKKKQLENLGIDLRDTSKKLTQNRKSVFKEIEEAVVSMVGKLGIPKAQFKLEHHFLPDFTMDGQDNIRFLFSANKGLELDDMTKIASGGEISRLMLALKQLLSQSSELSTLILDEIDTGVSGEIADKMGKMMREMAKNRQLIVITHLPQIAAKGDLHFKVMKEENENSTVTKVIELQGKDRLSEIAQLLSGENITEAAINNAKELIKV